MNDPLAKRGASLMIPFAGTDDRSLGPSDVTVPAKMHSVAVLKALFGAPRTQPCLVRIKLLDRSRLRHDPDLGRIDFGLQFVDHLLDLDLLCWLVDDKFHLVIGSLPHQSLDNRNGPAAAVMLLLPLRTGTAVAGAAASQFGADRHQIADDILVDRSGSFDGRMQAAIGKLLAQRDDGWIEHRFATG